MKKITRKNYKKAHKKCQGLSKEVKEKKGQYGCERPKIYQKMENKSWLNLEKNIIKWEKMSYYNYKKLFSFY